MDLSNIAVNKQSSIRIAASKILYFDPFELTDEKHDADIIFITHEHFDHFDPASIGKIINENTCIVAPKSMEKKLLSESLTDVDKCFFYEPNTVNELKGITIKTVPAYNILKPFHMKSARWQGYLVDIDGVSYYVSGDTDANEDVKKVKCDVAILPIGGHFTMDKKHAVQLVNIIKPKAVIPTHYGPIVGNAEDGSEFKNMLENSGLDIQVELRI